MINAEIAGRRESLRRGSNLFKRLDFSHLPFIAIWELPDKYGSVKGSHGKAAPLCALVAAVFVRLK